MIEIKNSSGDAIDKRRQTIHKTAGTPSFYRSRQPSSKPTQAIVESGVCASIIDEETFQLVELGLDIPIFQKAKILQDSPWLGDSPDEHETLFAIKIPFVLENTTSALFEVTFGVINGELPL